MSVLQLHRIILSRRLNGTHKRPSNKSGFYCQHLKNIACPKSMDGCPLFCNLLFKA
jgi:hypothetical protein